MTGMLYIGRHGRTEWNGRRFLGRVDVPLNAEGHAQAEALVGLFHGRPIDVILRSPLLRAAQTAAPLAAQRGLVAVVDDDLVEMDCGAWEGRLKEGSDAKISRRPPDARMPGGESLADVLCRTRRAAASLTPLVQAGAAVLVVTHYLTGQVLAGQLLGYSLAETLETPTLRCAPGAVLTLGHDTGAWTLLGRLSPDQAGVPR